MYSPRRSILGRLTKDDLKSGVSYYYTVRAHTHVRVLYYTYNYLETISICPHNINHLLLSLTCTTTEPLQQCTFIDDYGCDLRIGFRTHLHDNNNIILFF